MVNKELSHAKIKEKNREIYCVAAGCTSSNADSVSVHEFPNESRRKIRRKCINFVKTLRDFQCCVNLIYPAEYKIKQPLVIEVKKKSLFPDAVQLRVKQEAHRP